MSGQLLIRGLDVGPGGGPRALLLAGGRVVAVDAEAEAAAPDARVVSADGLFAAPGYIDLQVNGIGGRDFTTDPASMWTVGRQLAALGVTSFLPTIVTSPRGTVEAAVDAFVAGPRHLHGARPLGIHVEGPFIAPARAGAHRADLLRHPDLEEIGGWLAGDAVRILTLAPELPGAMEAIATVAAAGRVASIGHTDADAATTARAVDAGARYATHLFNAMPPLLHRDPGAVGAMLVDERVTLGLIVDDRHLDPLVVDLVARLAPGRVSLVSDAISAAGLEEGTHRLAGESVSVTDGAARLGDGTLAGSVAGLDACVRRFARVCGAAAAIESVTATPARLLGLDDRGALRVGMRAEIVLLDEELGVRATIVDGGVVHDADGRWQ